MKELDDLLDALASHMNTAIDDEYGDDPTLHRAYRAYKSAPKPLVLEQVEYDDIKVGEGFLGWCNLMYMTFSKSANRIKDEQKGKCYRLPREEQ